MLTQEKIEKTLREYHELVEEWRTHCAEVEIEIFGTVPDAIFNAHCRKASIERNPELWAKLTEVNTNIDIQKAEIELRMVEAHEWLRRGLREEASQS